MGIGEFAKLAAFSHLSFPETLFLSQVIIKACLVDTVLVEE